MVAKVKVVEPDGILDSIHGDELRQKVHALIADGVDILLLDLKDIMFMDSCGLASIVLVYRSLLAANGQMFICSMKEQVKILFELTGLDTVFNIYPSREEFNIARLDVEKMAA